MTERELQDAVLEAAGFLGWLRVHFRPAQVGGRWVTAMQGDAGFPDCVFARAGRVIVAELKATGKNPTGEQRRWLDALTGPAVEVFVWKPADWLDGTIERVLRG